MRVYCYFVQKSINVEVIYSCFLVGVWINCYYYVISKVNELDLDELIRINFKFIMLKRKKL